MNCWSNWCKKGNQLDTGLIALPCPITTPMNLTFKFQIKACVSKMNAVARAQLTFQMLTLLQNIYTTRDSIQRHGTANVWPWYLNRLEHSALIRRLGGRVPLKSIHFLSQKFWHFRKNTSSCVENDCCCPHTVNISNVNFTSKISTPPEPVFKNMGQQMSGPDSSIV